MWQAYVLAGGEDTLVDVVLAWVGEVPAGSFGLHEIGEATADVTQRVADRMAHILARIATERGEAVDGLVRVCGEVGATLGGPRAQSFGHGTARVGMLIAQPGIDDGQGRRIAKRLAACIEGLRQTFLHFPMFVCDDEATQLSKRVEMITLGEAEQIGPPETLAVCSRLQSARGLRHRHIARNDCCVGTGAFAYLRPTKRTERVEIIHRHGHFAIFRGD
jgi:hypothetical protein